MILSTARLTVLMIAGACASNVGAVQTQLPVIVEPERPVFGWLPNREWAKSMDIENVHDAAAILTIWREARGEPWLGKLAVAHVIRTRTKEGERGDSPGAVCLWPRQFSCWDDAQRTKFPKPDDNEWANCAEVWYLSETVEDPVKGANHYHADSITPDWAIGVTPLGHIGHHVFYHL